MWLSTKQTGRRKKKKKNLQPVSVVNKSRYRDTHSEDTISNVRDTDYLFFVDRAVSRKQDTMYTMISSVCNNY